MAQVPLRGSVSRLAVMVALTAGSFAPIVTSTASAQSIFERGILGSVTDVVGGALGYEAAPTSRGQALVDQAAQQAAAQQAAAQQAAAEQYAAQMAAQGQVYVQDGQQYVIQGQAIQGQAPVQTQVQQVAVAYQQPAQQQVVTQEIVTEELVVEQGSGLPFQIIVEGDVNARADGYGGATSGTDIQVQFDGLDIEKSANVAVLTPDLAEPNGEATHAFVGYWNYSTWVERAEIRIFNASRSTKGRPLQVIDMPEDRIAPLALVSEKLRNGQLQYVMRLYDDKGNFDETEPKLLGVSSIGKLAYGDGIDDLAEGWDQNTLAINGIDVAGGAVTVYGDQVPEGHQVYVMGQRVPVAGAGDFVTKEILPGGDHQVRVQVFDAYGEGIDFARSLFIPEHELFYVALGEITIGSTAGSGPSELVGENDGIDDISVEGRGAFFLKGKVRGDILITAMADTGYGTLEELVTNIDKKDPRHLIHRIDPDKHYSVYGDDSTVTEEALTQGKFYVRVEKNDSFVMWGNYQTGVTGNEFVNLNRGLYGAKLQYQSEAKTSFGEARIRAVGFGAQPGTLPQRDEFRGTGGSLYFLSHQDITIGSEKLAVEVRDANTGVVLNVKELRAGEDYEIDYLQGRIILAYPLASTVEDNFIIKLDQGLNGNAAYLVTNYEFTPATREIGGNVAGGGRASAWIGDNIQVGLVGGYDNTEAKGNKVVGADVTARMSGGTYLKGSYARSSGGGVATTNSVDGGFTNCNNSNVTTTDAENCVTNSSPSIIDDGAQAFGVEAAVDLEDMGVGGIRATLGGYYQRKEKGFAGGGAAESTNNQSYGLHASLPVGDGGPKISARVTRSDNLDTEKSDTKAQFDVSASFADALEAGLGLGVSHSTDTGMKTDIGVKLGYQVANGVKVSATAQTTVASDDPDLSSTRLGLGVDAQVTDKISVGGSADLDVATGKATASIKTDYAVDDRTNFYLAYQNALRTNIGTGTQTNTTAGDPVAGNVTFGGRSRLMDSLSVFGEERLVHEGLGLTGVTHAYGVDYTPTERISLSSSVELGTVTDKPTGADVERMAASVQAGYQHSGMKFGAAAELRTDTDADGNEANSWLLKANAGAQVDPSWKLAAKIAAVISSKNGDLQSGNFVDGDVGFAYRPIKGDRLNALFNYRFYADLQNEEAENASNGSYKQRSHILSADVNFNATNELTIGAKYGMKYGARTLDATSDEFYTSTTHLGIVRADYHVVKNWDALVEGRVLVNQENKQAKYGALVGVYRHMGDNFKVGGGYNFSGVSDDLTNTEADAHGWFINAIAKF